jgi:hypothetical protein
MSTTLPSTRAAIPPDVVRQYSFTDHSVNQPNTPQPGDRLDGEIDRSNAAINQLSGFLEQTFDAQGKLLPESVGMSQLDPLAVATIEQRVTPNLEPFVTASRANRDEAVRAALDADASAHEAASHAQYSAGNAELARTAAEAAMGQGVAIAEQVARAAETQTEIDNFASDAELAAAQAQNDARLAGGWAEYMEGGAPIPASFFAHTSITGQHWSSRWWANQAAMAFGALASLYLGAYPEPPATTPTGNPIPLGAIYYDTTTNQPYVWDGTQWQPFYAPPTKALTQTLVYVATAEQTLFDTHTPDIAGNIYVLNPTITEPIEAYINGVRVIYDAPVGQGDFTVDKTTSRVQFTHQLLAGSLVILDILAPADALIAQAAQPAATPQAHLCPCDLGAVIFTLIRDQPAPSPAWQRADKLDITGTDLAAVLGVNIMPFIAVPAGVSAFVRVLR